MNARRRSLLNPFTTLPLLPAVAALAFVGATLTACKEQPTPTTVKSAAEDADDPVTLDDGTHRVRYVTRGTIAQMPTAMGDLMIQHEAIPEFRGNTGEIVGMNTMTMEFPLAEGVSLEGLAPGDKVEVTFVVKHAADWSLQGWETTAITKLPAETELDFSPLTPPDRAQPAAEPEADAPGAGG